MNNDKPVLSICIPTYNRAELLKKVLESIVNDDCFQETDDVEIVVADNASTDETREICENWAGKFPTKFLYIRQPENLGYSNNMLTLMRSARGEFFKFHCDTFCFLPGKLAESVALIKKWDGSKPLIFFRNDHIYPYPQGCYEIRTSDDFLEKLSFLSVWTGGFGFWAKDRELAIKVSQETADTLIPQTAVIWEIFDKSRFAVVHNFRVYEELWPTKKSTPKGGYNRAEVFGVHYLDILKKYKGLQGISDQAYEKEKKRLYFCMIYRTYFDFFKVFNFTKGHYYRFTAEYHRNLYYWLSLMYVPVLWCVARLPIGVVVPLRNLFVKIKNEYLR